MTTHPKTANPLKSATKTAKPWRSNYPTKSMVFTKTANRQRASGNWEKSDMNTLVAFPDEELPSRTYQASPGHGFVYLIRANGQYKIGKTRHLRERLMALQSQCPVPLEVVHYVETVLHGGLESDLHTRYGAGRTHGEWFALSEEEAADVTAHMDTWAADMAADRARIATTYAEGRAR